ncbi:hypothetical protein MES5069_440084 [Mesorhizobium escarrei]|uniref:Uncharacterized protein n=1 Tax=Mesorhizobium escarrei TaxID=666018 RepID=A0ABN8K377_9HYPH|nr:hypothetical protein MES5069_440084 [Mesorhizobium escarrei]
MGVFLEKAEIGKLAPEFRRHFDQSRFALAEIGRCVRRFQIPPALKGAARLPFSAHDRGIEHQVTAADTLVIGERTDFGDQLAALHIALDHPVEGTAIGDLGAARRHHAGGVVVLDRFTGAPPFVEAEGDPLFQIFDAVAANAELYEIEGHGLRFSPGRDGVNGPVDFLHSAAILHSANPQCKVWLSIPRY